MNIQISNCQYLFGQEAEAIFSNIKDMSVEEKIYIDQCLDLMMRVNVYILKHKDGFCLIDPRAYNDQCHLYALRAAQIKASYHNKSKKERLARTQENRFLHLSIFLSFILAFDTNLMHKTVLTAMQKIKAEIPKFKETLDALKFETFLIDKGNYREKASRASLNVVFEEHIKLALEQTCEENKLLYSELSKLAKENLLLPPNYGNKKDKKKLLYTLPKLAGIAYLVDVIRREQIPFVIKVKVITQDGAAGIIVAASGNIEKNQPAIVFEGFATVGKSIKDCKNDAKNCPTYFYRNIKALHKEDKACFYCKKTSEVDLKSYLQNVKSAIDTPDDMLYALGADFMLNCQPSFVQHFENKVDYPLLSELFEKAIPKIKELGLDMNNPETFSVCHVHMDIGSHALSEELLLDQTHEVFLKTRGLI